MSIYNCHGKFPGKPLKGKERYKKLYHYTSFDSFVKIWLNKNLRFSSSEKVNDILEAKKDYTAPVMPQIPLIIALQEAKASYKQISLTMDFDSYLWGCMSSMMWGYYADKRLGVCIELDYDKLVFSPNMMHRPVIYKKYVSKNIPLDASVVSIKTLNKFLKKRHKEIFFTKDLGWKGENEYRIISNQDDYLDISNAITAVYLTEYDSQECLLVEKLVNGGVPIKCVKYNSSGKNNIAIPVIVDTKSKREEMNRSKNTDNLFLQMEKQARIILAENKGNENASLLMDISKFLK